MCVCIDFAFYVAWGLVMISSTWSLSWDLRCSISHRFISNFSLCQIQNLITLLSFCLCLLLSTLKAPKQLTAEIRNVHSVSGKWGLHFHYDFKSAQTTLLAQKLRTENCQGGFHESHWLCCSSLFGRTYPSPSELEQPPWKTVGLELAFQPSHTCTLVPRSPWAPSFFPVSRNYTHGLVQLIYWMIDDASRLAWIPAGWIEN